MTDTLLTLLIIIGAINTGISLWNGRFAIDPMRIAQTIYADILISFDGHDNMTPEMARQQANARFTKWVVAVGYPMKAKDKVINLVVQLTREKHIPITYETKQELT